MICRPSMHPQVWSLLQSVRRLLPKFGSEPLTVQSMLWAKRFACAIRSTGSSCPGRRALSAAGRRRIRIISRLCNLVHLDTESAMSSLSRFVGPTTASFIARVTRPRGGARSTSILFQSRSGSGSTRGRMAMNSPQAKALRRRRPHTSWTCQFKIKRVGTTMPRADVKSAVFKDADPLASG